MTGRILDETALGETIDAHYRAPGDLLIRMERLPLYAVDQQSAELQAWRNGAPQPDSPARRQWLDVLADEVRRGLSTRRIRILSADLSDDEQRACHWGYPQVGRYENIRVLHRGEHPVPDLVDHDYYLLRPADGPQVVIRLHYTPAGAFNGAEIIPDHEHDLYGREIELAWSIGEPFTRWWARHGELHRREAA